MAISFFQKLKLAIRGWSRRREQAAVRQQQEFLQRNTAWTAAPAPASKARDDSRSTVDLEGLQVAFLDDSGRMEHYLDVESGEVVEFLMTDRPSHSEIAHNPTRYKRVPTRSAMTEREDRAAFVSTVESPAIHSQLQLTLSRSDAAGEFRQILSTDRGLERAWYNFKNDRATAAIDSWLQKIAAGK